MSYQNIMNAPLFDFGDIKKSEITIKNTWNEFQAALANKTFKYDEVESAMTTTFLKVFDDLFANCCVRLDMIIGTDGTPFLMHGVCHLKIARHWAIEERDRQLLPSVTRFSLPPG